MTGGSRQEVRNRTGKLCEINKPDGRDSAGGCGTGEWNVMSGKVEHNREMQKLGRSEGGNTNEQNIMQVVPNLLLILVEWYFL